MFHIHIIGNSGAAKECYWIIQDIMKADSTFATKHTFAGFFAWKGFGGSLDGLSEFLESDLDNYSPQEGDMFVIGIGKPELRRDVYTTMKARGANFMNLIHPLADVCPSAKIGEGNIFHRHSTIYTDAICGNANYFNGYVNVSHDAKIGDYNFFAPYSIVLGYASICNTNHLGPHSVMIDHSRIGNNNVILPGSIVYKGCNDYCRLLGNPALEI